MCDIFGTGTNARNKASQDDEAPKAPAITDETVSEAGEEAAKSAASRDSVTSSIETSPLGLVNFDPEKLFSPTLGGVGGVLGQIGTGVKNTIKAIKIG